MIELLQFLLLALAIGLSLAGLGFDAQAAVIARIRRIAAKYLLVVIAIALASFLGCVAVAGVLHEPVPRTHDEFSYLLLTT